VEVLVVVVIIVSVTAFAVPAYKKTQEKAKFNNALGVLIQIGTGVQALRADMRMEGLSYSFPVTNAPVQVTGAWNGGDTVSRNSTYRTVQAAGNLEELGNENNTKLGYALVAREYMAELPYDGKEYYNGYQFYVCPDGVASSSKCCINDASVVACMRGTGSYAKAVFYTDGTTENFSS